MAALNFEITCNTAEAQRELQEVRNQVGMTSAAFQKLVNTKLNEFTDQLKIQRNEVDSLTKKMAKLVEAKTEAAKAGDTAKMAETSRAMRELQEEINAETTALGTLETNYNALNSVILQFLSSEQQATQAQEGATSSSEKHNATMIKMLGGQEKYNKIMGALPASVRNAVSSLEQLTTAARAFIATPLGAILGAIVLVLGALHTALTSSADGQMTLTKYTGYLKGVFAALKEVVIFVGNALIKCFKDPQKAVKDLWEAIKENLFNRFKALGDLVQKTAYMLQHFMDSDFDWKKYGKDMTDTLLQMGTGVEKLTDKLDKAGKKMGEIAKRTSELDVAEEKLNRRRSAWQEREAELDAKITEFRSKMYTATDDASRMRYQKDVQKLINEKYTELKAQAAEALRIRKERNALTTSSQEDIDEQHRLQAELTRLNAAEKQEMMFFDRRAAAAERREVLTAKQMEQLKKQSAKAEIQLARKLRQQTTQAEIDAMKEGSEKKLAQINLNYEKEKDALEKMKEDYLNQKRQIARKQYEAKNPGKIFDEETVQLTDAELQQFGKLGEAAYQSYVKTLDDFKVEEQESRLQFLQAYGTYEEKKLAITEEYEAKIRDTTDKYTQMTLERQKEAALEALNFDAFKDKINWEGLFGNLQSATRKQLDKLREQIEEYMNSAEFKDAQPDVKKSLIEGLENIKSAYDAKSGAIAAYFENRKGINDAEKALAEADANLEIAKGTLQSVQGLKSRGMATDGQEDAARKKVNEAEEKRNKAQKDLDKKIIDSQQKLVNALTEVSQGLAAIGEIAETLGVDPNSKTGKAISAATDTVNNGIGAATDFMSGNYMGAAAKGIKAIASAVSIFDSGNMEETNKELAHLAQVNSVLSKVIEELRDKLQNGPITEVLDTAKKLLENTKLSEEISIKSIQKQASAWESGSHSVNAILNDKSSFRAMLAQASEYIDADLRTSQDFIGLTAKQKYEIQEQNRELYAAILNAYTDAENKHTGSGIAGMIMSQVDEYAKAEEEALKQTRDRFTSTTFDSFRDSFDNVLLDMNSSAEDFTDNLEQMLRNALIKGLASKTVHNELQQLYDDIADTIQNNPNLTLTEADIVQFRERYQAIADEVVAGRDVIDAIMGNAGLGSSTSTAKGVAAMSQSTAEELNGRFTALQMSNEGINQNVALAVTSLQTMLTLKTQDSRALGEIQNLMIMNNGYLEDILTACKQSATYAAKLQEIADNTKNI